MATGFDPIILGIPLFIYFMPNLFTEGVRGQVISRRLLCILLLILSYDALLSQLYHARALPAWLLDISVLLPVAFDQVKRWFTRRSKDK